MSLLFPLLIGLVNMPGVEPVVPPALAPVSALSLASTTVPASPTAIAPASPPVSAAPPLMVAGRMTATAHPQSAVATAMVGAGNGGGISGPMEIWRDPDGLFYVHGLINGRPVRFLVDTGASMIVLTEDDARAVGVEGDMNAANLQAETANGKSAMARVMLNSIQVGGTGAARVPAAVARQGLQVSLLGQNWLSHLASMTIQGDRMLLQ